MGSTLVFVSVTVDFLQVLGFPFSKMQQFPLHPAYTNWFLEVLTRFRLEGWTNPNPDPTQNQQGSILFYLIFCFVVFVISCAIYVGYSFSKNRFKYLWPLKVLRSFASMTTILYIPILNQFVRNLRCGTEGCFATTFGSIESTATMVSGFSFVLFSFLVQCTYFEDDPTRNVGVGRPHSRADVCRNELKRLKNIPS